MKQDFGGKNLFVDIENDKREKGIFHEHLNQFRTSKTMLPKRKRETREEILKQNQWSHCLKKIKNLFSWEGVYSTIPDEI